ncbi:hypothetical protein DEO72_LG1g2304 [Vigna unguiculata]|uniref:Uncharacterized protein n=1 Tax=Vigna unguiculata TaxID=3917 RepID=A0A4D6KM48_VIGUN|nr:hypothetical protein DEO72_LG1g2304 [Vigna unguiculata]
MAFFPLSPPCTRTTFFNGVWISSFNPPLVLPTTPSPRTVFTGTASFTCSVQRATLRSPSHCVLCLYFSAASLSRRYSSTSHASTAPTMLHHHGILC